MLIWNLRGTGRLPAFHSGALTSAFRLAGIIPVAGPVWAVLGGPRKPGDTLGLTNFRDWRLGKNPLERLTGLLGLR